MNRISKWASLVLGVLGKRIRGSRKCFRVRFREFAVGGTAWVQARLLSRAAPASVDVPWPARLTDDTLGV